VITVTPNPDGTAVLLWDGQPVAQMRSYTQAWEGIEASGFELLTHGGLHLSALQPQTLIDELTMRIKEKLQSSGKASQAG